MNKRYLYKSLATATAIASTAILLVSTLLLTTGCGGNNSPLRITAGVQTSSGISTLNPFWAQRFPNDAFVGLICEPLIIGLNDGSFEPCLASDWSVSDNGLEWTVNIDPDAKWSDGKSVTADDVVFTFKQHYENAGEWSQGRGNTGLMIDADSNGKPDADAVVSIDDKTVRFRLKNTYGAFPQSLSTVFICPKHIWEPKIAALEAADSSIEQYALEEESDSVIASLLIGSGPFKFKSYEPLQYVLFETDKNYWGGTPAKVDEVMLKMYATADGATLALKNGDVDMLALVEAMAEVPKLLLDQNIKIKISSFNSTVMFYLNMRYRPLNVYEVRKAIDMVIERQDIIDYAAFGYAALPQQIPFAPGFVESNPDVAWIDQYVDAEGDQLPLITRIDNANALLDAVPGMSTIEGGIDGIRTYNGEKVSFEGLYLSSPAYETATKLIADDLLEIGIEIIPTMETGAFGPKVFSGQQRWAYETIIFGYPQKPNFDHPSCSRSVIGQWASKVCFASSDGGVVGWLNDPAEAPPGTEGGHPQTYDTPYENPTAEQLAEYLALYNQLVADSTDLIANFQAIRSIIDPDDRLDTVYAVQEEFAEALPIINLYHPYSLAAYRIDKFEGWGDSVGIEYFGSAPPTISVRTLMSVSPIEN